MPEKRKHTAITLDHFRQQVIYCCVIVVMMIPLKGAWSQLVMSPNSRMTVTEGSRLYVGTNMRIESSATNTAYFADQNVGGNVTITGSVDVERYMTPNMWHNIASPVSNETTNCLSATDLVFYYDETIILNHWEFGWVMYSGPLEVPRGYDVLFWDNPVLVTYHASPSDELNTGAYTIPITRTNVPNGEIPSHKGWNLVGNPYPSPCDWLASGWDQNATTRSKYIWDGTNSIYTIFIGGGAPIGINGGTRYIPANQGFWIQALNNNTFGISNPVRMTQMTATPDFYKTDSIDYPLVSLKSHGNGYSDEVIIRFIEGTTSGFDINYDASKLYSPEEAVPQITIREDDLALALNTYPEIFPDLSVNLDFRCGLAGSYQIEMTERTELEEDVQVYLKDEIDGKMVNLSENLSYEFYHTPQNRLDRFKVFFNPSSDVLNNVTMETYFTVYSYGNNVSVVKNTVKDVSGNVCVYNLLGQSLCTDKLDNSGKSVMKLNVPTGYYIVSIVTPKHTYNSKVFINN